MADRWIGYWKMADDQTHATMLIDNYVRAIGTTDKMKPDIQPVLFGLFGEVGGIMTAAKKHHREGEVFSGFQRAVEEEFGDTLWYLAAVCRRLELSLEDILAQATSGDDYASILAASDMQNGTVSRILIPRQVLALDDALLTLGQAVSHLLVLPDDKQSVEQLLVQFVDCYLKTLKVSGFSFDDVARSNLTKTTGRFVRADIAELPTFDDDFDADEQLPNTFEIEIMQKKAVIAICAGMGFS